MAELPLGPGALALILLYLASTVLIGWAGRMASRERTQADFFLAGRRMGTFTLLMTLFATQYSGNSFIGFPGQTYRIGWAFVYGVTAMQAIVVFYLLYAPRLKDLTERADLVTPGDFLLWRYGSRALHLAATGVMIFALSNFVLSQMKAMGHLVAGMSGGTVPFAAGVVLLAVVMVAYETLGGMRSVAWTDVLQGLLLLLGAAGVLVLILVEVGGIAQATETVRRLAPDKVAVPGGPMLRNWISTVLLVGIGGCVYPQAIQRIYAAGSARALRRSLCVMAFLPLLATSFTVFVGIAALALHPGLQGAAADRAMPLVLTALMGSSAVGYWLAVLVTAAALAAIMSTADSGLLTLSSMFTRDLLQRYLSPERPETFYIRTGKVASWTIMGCLCFLAVLTPTSIWHLLEIKFEVLIQVFPAFVLGVRSGTRGRGTGGTAVLAGLVAGCVVSLSLLYGGLPRVWGIHGGLLGLGANFIVCWSLRHKDNARRAPSAG